MLFLLTLLFFANETFAQTSQCIQTDKNYISDGQEYLIITKHKEESTLDIIFYPGIDYRIKICPENANAIIEMSILDKKSIQLFTNIDKNYINEWDFKFQALMNASVKIKIKQSINKEEPVRILITYKVKR